MTKPKTAKELLEQTRDLMSEAQWFAPIAEDGGNIEGNFDQLAARVERVLALHTPEPSSSHPEAAPICRTCVDDAGRMADWPCATVRLLDGEDV